MIPAPTDADLTSQNMSFIRFFTMITKSMPTSCFEASYTNEPKDVLVRILSNIGRKAEAPSGLNIGQPDAHGTSTQVGEKLQRDDLLSHIEQLSLPGLRMPPCTMHLHARFL